MGKINVIKQTLSTEYKYDGSTIIIDGAIVKDAEENLLTELYGTVFRPNDKGDAGVSIGNFHGYLRNGKMKYNFGNTEMELDDQEAVLAAIKELEAKATPSE